MVANRLRCSSSRHGRLTLEYDDAVSQVRGHYEVVFDDEGCLLSVENVPARCTIMNRRTMDALAVWLSTS